MFIKLNYFRLRFKNRGAAFKSTIVELSNFEAIGKGMLPKCTTDCFKVVCWAWAEYV